MLRDPYCWHKISAGLSLAMDHSLNTGEAWAAAIIRWVGDDGSSLLRGSTARRGNSISKGLSGMSHTAQLFRLVLLF